MLFDSKLFREQALAKKGQNEPLDQLLRVTAPREWMILGALAFAMLCVVLWSIFGGIERKIEAQCILALPGERKPVVAVDTGIVLEVLVRPGERIERGGALARIRPTRLIRRRRAARAMLAAQKNLPPGVAENEGGGVESARSRLRAAETILAAGEFITSAHSGEVVSILMSPGQPVTEGMTVARIRTGAEHRITALSLVKPHLVGAIKPGMPSRIVIARESRETIYFNTRVEAISPWRQGVFAWLSDYGLAPEPGSRIVRMSLPGKRESSISKGTRCRVWFVQPEISLFRMLLASGPDPQEAMRAVSSGNHTRSV